MMENSKNDFWFEQILRSDCDSSSVDFRAVEELLFARIRESDELGVLSLLKTEQILPVDKFQHLEKELFAQIAEYKEYEVPVNECIRNQEDLTSLQWERLEAKLFAKIKDQAATPVWEQLIMAPEREPLAGEWEQIEDRIFEEITQSDKQEPWVLCARNEEICTPAIIEKEEQLLEDIISCKDSISAWEQEIKREVVLSVSQVEKIEETLLNRIEKENQKLKLEKQPFWFIINHYLTVVKTGTVAVLLLMLGGVTGFLYNTKSVPTSIATVAYQISGAAVDVHRDKLMVENECSSVKGGLIKLVNKHGTIELLNDSKLELSEVTEQRAHYKVSFPASHRVENSGRVTFFVNKHTQKDEIKITTSDYQITVMGTYFQIEPDANGSVITRVLEGVVKISSTESGETEIHAGQIYQFDQISGRYITKDGGQVVLREAIDKGPDVNSILSNRMLYLFANQPDVQVYVNDSLYGVAPLVVHQKIGNCRVKFVRDGYISFDTSFTITGNDKNGIELTAVLTTISKPVIAKKDNLEKKSRLPYRVPAKPVDPQPDLVITPEQISRTFMETSEPENRVDQDLYLKAQKEELAGNWENAINFYQQVIDNQNASKLRREDALFSIGRLKAENIHNPAEAMQAFLTYLALYPQGSFAGESWLRLAELEFRNRPEKATHYYEKFFQMFPRHHRTVELKNRVGTIYLQQKRYDDAIGMFKEALQSPALREKEKNEISENLDRALLEKAKSTSSLVNN